MKNARDQTPRVVGVPAGIRAEIYSKRFRQPVSPTFSMLGDIERQFGKMRDQGVCNRLKTLARVVRIADLLPVPLVA
jgi:hypothetical protein